MTATPPLTLDGRYRLIAPIAAGGMSVVWRGHDQILARPIAVKLLASVPSDGSAADRVRHEAMAVARVSHPYIANVYDYGESPGPGGEIVPYIVMELVEGESLAQILRRGPLSWPTAAGICAQAASALAAAHQHGVVHRDVTPANIMLCVDGVKVVDFGVSATAGEPAETRVFGTPAYLAPERLSGRPAQAATDVYGLGLVLYQMLAGRLPWPAATATQMLSAHRYVRPAPLPSIKGMSRELGTLCRSTLAVDPAERPSALKLSCELSSIARAGDPRARPPLAGTTPSLSGAGSSGPDSSGTGRPSGTGHAGVARSSVADPTADRPAESRQRARIRPHGAAGLVDPGAATVVPPAAVQNAAAPAPAPPSAPAKSAPAKPTPGPVPSGPVPSGPGPAPAAGVPAPTHASLSTTFAAAAPAGDPSRRVAANSGPAPEEDTPRRSRWGGGRAASAAWGDGRPGGNSANRRRFLRPGRGGFAGARFGTGSARPVRREPTSGTGVEDRTPPADPSSGSTGTPPGRGSTGTPPESGRTGKPPRRPDRGPFVLPAILMALLMGGLAWGSLHQNPRIVTVPKPKPSVTGPTTHKPSNSGPANSVPSTHKPSTHKPSTHKPSSHQPSTHKPTTGKSGNPAHGSGSKPAAAVACKVDYQVLAQWVFGFTAQVTITNTGTEDVGGWTLRFALSPGQSVGGGWSGDWSQHGHTVTVRDNGIDQAVPAGGQLTIGFLGVQRANTSATPARFSLNGTACAH